MSLLKYRLLILTNSMGLLAALYSLFFTERLNSFISPGNLMCDINKIVSCSTIYISSYSFIFNLPISLFVLLFFWFVFSILIINKNEKNSTQTYQLLSILNIVALICCLYFLYILIYKLKSICLSCLLIDTMVFLNFSLLFNYLRMNFKIPRSIFGQLFIKNWLFLFSFTLLFGCGLILYKAYQIILNKKNKEFLELFFMQQQNKDIYCSNSISFGNQNAKVKIIIFSDIYCGYCKVASEKYRQIFSKDSSVKLEFIYYPINHLKSKMEGDTTVNTFFYRVMLSASLDKEFWNFHDLIINQIDNLDSVKVFRLAQKSLQNFETFSHSFSSSILNYSLKENILLAEDYKVQGTPSIFIDGREFRQWNNIILLKMIVKQYKNTKP
jgi:uncharacterized membrane protein